MAAIRLERVTKVYPDGTAAIREIDLEVPDGRFMVLVGPSGCGKTTLLRLVAGLEEITGGIVRIGDEEVNDYPPRDRDVAMVFQNYALYPHMTVYENMGFGLKLRATPKEEIDRRVRAAATMLGLTDELDRRPHVLSGGQRQRVAMGRAIVRQPKAFLMDEPLSDLDAKLRLQMRVEIATLQRSLGTTTLYVTHDQNEAVTLGDLVAVMRMGVIQQVGSPQELYQDPANLFVAGFIGAPAMNLLNATLRYDRGALEVDLGGDRLTVDEGLLYDRPALWRYANHEVIAGIRPEDMEDAVLLVDPPADRVLRVGVDRRELLGREAHLYFTLDTPPAVTQERLLDAAVLDVTAAWDLQAQQTGRRTRCMARISADSPAAEGGRASLFVDTRNLYFFDPDTGRAITDDSRPIRPPSVIELQG
jgi:multiple sugar transport system ATP-binding protein